MRNLFGLMLFVAFAVAACTVSSDSGGVSEPISNVVAATTEAGSSTVSAAEIDPNTCAGVLAPATGDLGLDTQSLTEGVKTSQPQIVSMCSAMYYVEQPSGEFLTIALMQFDSDDSAVAHYELMKSEFVESGVPISEINSADEGLIDEVSGLMDRDGIGRTNVFRQREWLVSVSVGPTMVEAPWVVGDIEMIGRGVLGRVK